MQSRSFLSLCASTTALPAERKDQIIMLGVSSGEQTVGSDQAEFSYNDCGRGDHIRATWKLDPARVPIEYLHYFFCCNFAFQIDRVPAAFQQLRLHKELRNGETLSHPGLERRLRRSQTSIFRDRKEQRP